MPSKTKKKLAFEPIGTRLVVKRDAADDMTKGGIALPDNASRDKPRLGTVIAVGPGRQQPDGSFIPGQVKNDDRVILSNFAGDVFTHDEEEYVMASEQDVLAILRNE